MVISDCYVSLNVGDLPGAVTTVLQGVKSGLPAAAALPPKWRKPQVDLFSCPDPRIRWTRKPSTRELRTGYRIDIWVCRAVAEADGAVERAEHVAEGAGTASVNGCPTVPAGSTAAGFS